MLLMAIGFKKSRKVCWVLLSCTSSHSLTSHHVKELMHVSNKLTGIIPSECCIASVDILWMKLMNIVMWWLAPFLHICEIANNSLFWHFLHFWVNIFIIHSCTTHTALRLLVQPCCQFKLSSDLYDVYNVIGGDPTLVSKHYKTL